MSAYINLFGTLLPERSRRPWEFNSACFIGTPKHTVSLSAEASNNRSSNLIVRQPPPDAGVGKLKKHGHCRAYKFIVVIRLLESSCFG